MGRPRTLLPKLAILNRYRNGESSCALAKSYGCADTTIRKYLHHWGADMRRTGPARTYTLNEDYFQQIDNAEKAYWLGFLITDGSANNSGRTIRTELFIGDDEHLYKLAAAVGSDAEPKYTATPSTYLDLSSAKLCQDLANLEVYPNKTAKHGTPKLPYELYSHFYRGCFDGDGGIHMAHNTCWGFEFTGSPRFVRDFQAWLMQNTCVNETKLVARTCTLSIRYQGGRQIERIMRVLYSGSTPETRLDRKYELFQKMLGRNKLNGFALRPPTGRRGPRKNKLLVV